MSPRGHEIGDERGFAGLAAFAGLLFAVLWAVAGLVADLPPSNSRAVEVADFFDAEHARVVTSVYLQGLALGCFLFFLSGVSVRWRRAGEGWLGTIVLASGVTLTALLGLAAIVHGALAYRATDDASVAQSLFDLALLARTFAAFPLAALVAAAGLAALRSGSDPRSYGGASIAVAALFLAAAATYGGAGFFAPGGGYSRLAFVIFLAWVLITSALLMRRPRREPTVR